jgi:2-oxo-4-hydroxy-4-carboxy-5-ureidoimidazoline decarboxylase
MTGWDGLGLAGFNALPADRAEVALLACCSSRPWARMVLEGRRYESVAAVLAAADAALAGLTESELDQALAGHPRIGERPAAGHSAWSAREQAGVAGADADVQAALVAGNRAYEERFGHVYLVCATGRSAAELLALLNQRLGNDPATERAVVRAELGKINRIRLGRMLSEEADRQ